MVNISLRVLSRPVSDKLPEIHQTLGVDFDEKVSHFATGEENKSIFFASN